MDYIREITKEFNKLMVNEEFIGDIEACERVYEKLTGKEIIRLSYWNPDERTGDKMIKLIPFYDEIRTVNYILPYEINQTLKSQLLMKFGCANEDLDILLTSCGTLSIYSTINFLKAAGYSSIDVLAPVYFTVPYVCNNLNINCNINYLERDNQKYYITREQMDKLEQAEVIWVTNPVYCTGVYYKTDFINQMKYFLNLGKLIVLDESLALSGTELIRKFYNYENIISICSPHKSLCINGNKFSAIITNKKNISFFHAWADIISGCLSISNYKAIHHFLSEEFRNVNDFFVHEVQQGYSKVKRLCDKCGAVYDNNVMGCFMTVYYPKLPYDYLDKKENMQEVFFENGVSCITGSRNYFNPKLGLSFRINLTNIDQNKETILKRFLIKLKEIEHDKNNKCCKK